MRIPASAGLHAARSASRHAWLLGVDIVRLEARRPAYFDIVLSPAAAKRIDGLSMFADDLTAGHRGKVAKFASGNGRGQAPGVVGTDNLDRRQPDEGRHQSIPSVGQSLDTATVNLLDAASLAAMSASRR